MNIFSVLLLLQSLKFFAYQRERAIEDLKLSLVKLQGSASELC